MFNAVPTENRRWAWRLASLLVAAALCNGVVVYLKRIGVIDGAAFAAYWAHHCIPNAETPRRANESQCTRFTTPDAIARDAAGPVIEDARLSRYVFESTPAQRSLKLVKDFFAMGVIAVSLGLIARGRAPKVAFAEMAPLILLACYAVGALAMSIASSGPIVAVAGLRWFLFLGIALSAAWLTPFLGLFALAVVALLVAQLALAPLELVRGIHMSGDWLAVGWARRISGTLSQPSSLAVFSVCALAFWRSYAPNTRWALPLGAAAVALTSGTGSATGLLCLGLMLVMEVRERVPARWRRGATAAGGALIVLIALALPQLSGRERVFESVWSDRGRIAALEAALSERPVLEVVFGSGLGVNTNLTLNLMGAEGENALGVPNPIQALPADSTVTSLLTQLGVVGAVIFYGVMLWAGRRDPRGRYFYAVVFLASLTTNLLELFPVNALLAIAWACSATALRRNGDE